MEESNHLAAGSTASMQMSDIYRIRTTNVPALRMGRTKIEHRLLAGGARPASSLSTPNDPRQRFVHPSTTPNKANQLSTSTNDDEPTSMPRQHDNRATSHPRTLAQPLLCAQPVTTGKLPTSVLHRQADSPGMPAAQTKRAPASSKCAGPLGRWTAPDWLASRTRKRGIRRMKRHAANQRHAIREAGSAL